MKIFNIIIGLIFIVFTSYGQNNTNPSLLFDEFWHWVDKNYIYFDAKNLDWNAVYQKYAPTISDKTTEDELFDICEASILALKDAHSAISRPDKNGKVYDYKADYDIYFDFKIIKKSYIVDSLGSAKNLFWGLMNGNIGYIRLSNFTISSEFMQALMDMKSRKVSKIIIDVRNNGGGNSNTVPKLLSQFVDSKLPLGAYIEKIGPGHKEVTNPIWIYTDPKLKKDWDIPLVVMTNRMSYSATSYFAGMVKGLPNMKIVGQKTGGGGGGHLGYQLSNDWLVRVSVSDFIGKDMLSIELGVEPDILIENTKEDLENGIDKMLETAINLKF
ncbi:MAG: S41 family peptidase [Saprospiraceae bacterium]